MKLLEFAVVLVVLVILRELSGQVLHRLTGMGFLANFGSLALASFLGGWLASSIGTRPPTDRQLLLLAALGVIACTAIGYLLLGVAYLALAVIFILVLHTPISYVCLILGARTAEEAFVKPSRRPETDEESAPDR